MRRLRRTFCRFLATCSLFWLFLLFLSSTILMQLGSRHLPSSSNQHLNARASSSRWNPLLFVSSKEPPRFNLSATSSTMKVSLHSPTCSQEKTNVVYVKTHKTGSETVAAVFRRFGYLRNLSFVMPTKAGGEMLGFPYKLSLDWYQPSRAPDGKFNILCEHVLFEEDTVPPLMPPDSVYVTTIRDPFAHLRSYFYYTAYEKVVGISAEDPLAEFLQSPEHYERLYNKLLKRQQDGYPTALSIVKNSMAFELGFKVGFNKASENWTDDEPATKRWLEKVEKRFDLVLVVEYFDESMVLLKRLLCWKWKDVLYKTMNPTTWAKKFKDNSTESIQDLVKRYRQFSPVDYRLYDKFLEILKSKIEDGGEEFTREVAYYKKIQAEVTRFCKHERETMKKQMRRNNTLAFPAVLGVSEGFTITTHDCWMIGERLYKEILKRFESLPKPTQVAVVKKPVPGQKPKPEPKAESKPKPDLKTTTQIMTKTTMKQGSKT